MSVGPLGMIGTAAGSPLPQAQGADVQRTQQETTHQVRQAETERRAENAAGVGETEQDEQASDRDADGRRLWELPGEQASPGDDQNVREDSPPDPTGTQLDLQA